MVPVSAISTIPFLKQFSSQRSLSFLFDYSVTNIDPAQNFRKMPATVRKAVLILPPLGKAHTGPQRASQGGPVDGRIERLLKEPIYYHESTQ